MHPKSDLLEAFDLRLQMTAESDQVLHSQVLEIFHVLLRLQPLKVLLVTFNQFAVLMDLLYELHLQHLFHLLLGILGPNLESCLFKFECMGVAVVFLLLQYAPIH